MASNRSRKMFVVEVSYRTPNNVTTTVRDTVCESRTGVQDFLYAIAVNNWPPALGRIPTSRKTTVQRFFSEGGNTQSICDVPWTDDAAAATQAQRAEGKAMAAERRANRADSKARPAMAR
jgi:hypothetical protein